MALGTVMVISTMGIPARCTASAAKRASSGKDTRTPGIMPIASICARTSDFFMDGLFAESVPRLVEAPGPDRLAELLERGDISRHGLAISQLRGAIVAFSVQKIEESDGSPAISVLADIAAALGVVQGTGPVDSHQTIVRLNSEVGIPHIGEHLFVGPLLLFASLRDGIAGLCNRALV